MLDFTAFLYQHNTEDFHFNGLIELESINRLQFKAAISTHFALLILNGFLGLNAIVDLMPFETPNPPVKLCLPLVSKPSKTSCRRER